jgi:type IV/VI secretion system ImpK/VasF family protein
VKNLLIGASPLTLFELARELFTYLVRFREKASSTAAPPLPEVRRDLLGIFARMDNQAKRDPLLMDPYRQVHYALVGLADEVVLTSGWEHSPAWRQALLEERFYSTHEAGSRFFELAGNLDQAPQDVVAIFYLCLALGFSGRYAPADPELAEVKDKLLERLPSKPRIMEEPRSTRSQDSQTRKWLWSAVGLAVIVFAVVLSWDYMQTGQVSHVSAPPAPESKAVAESATNQKETAPQVQPETAQKTTAKAEQVVSEQAKIETAPRAETKSSPKPTPVQKPKAEKAEAEAPESTPPRSEAKPKEMAKGETPQKPAEASEKSPAAPAQAPSAATSNIPPEKSKVAESSQTARPEKTYRVRVGVYVGPIQSGRFADTLKKDGYPASVEKLDRPGGKVLYVVSITPLASLDEAERVRAEIKQKHKVNGVIKQD